MKGLQQFGGALAAPFAENTFADFLGEYILGLPVKELKEAESSTPEITTPIQPETVAPVVPEEMNPESETSSQQSPELEAPEAVPPEPQLSFAQQRQQAREAFDAIKNNPAREAGLDPDFLFARHKANLVSQLAKQKVKPADLKGTEQAFLADRLQKYLGSRREFNSGRDRGF